MGRVRENKIRNTQKDRRGPAVLNAAKRSRKMARERCLLDLSTLMILAGVILGE